MQFISTKQNIKQNNNIIMFFNWKNVTHLFYKKQKSTENRIYSVSCNLEFPVKY